jgi:predicted nucleic acid-binding protein
VDEERPVVSNTGPIIALASVGRLDLLRALFGRILLPRAVHRNSLTAVRRGQVPPWPLRLTG